MIKFDPTKKAIFEPTDLNLPTTKAIMVFDDEIWEDFIVKDKKIVIFPVKNTRGRVFDAFRMYKYNGEDILLVYPDTGASASAIEMELLIASGVNKIVAFGTCGALDKNIAKNTIIIPTAAVREEGTSYHYLPPSDEVSQSEKSLKTMNRILDREGFKILNGKIWTTDAVYRETLGKFQTMKQNGCVAVDMELSALLAVAEFRGTSFAEFLITDDNIDGKPERENVRDCAKIFDAALQVVTALY